jgi:hypothetical protein
LSERSDRFTVGHQHQNKHGRDVGDHQYFTGESGIERHQQMPGRLVVSRIGFSRFPQVLGTTEETSKVAHLDAGKIDS